MQSIAAIKGLDDDGLTPPPVWVGGRHEKVREVAAELSPTAGTPGAATRLVSPKRRPKCAGPHDRPMTTSWGGAVFIASDDDELSAFVENRGGSHGIIAGLAR